MSDFREKETGVHHHKRHHRRPVYKKAGFYILIASGLTLLYLMVSLYRFNIIPFIGVFILVDIEAVFLVLIWYLMIRRHRKKFRICGGIIAALLCFFNLFMGIQIQQIIGTIDQMNDTDIHYKGNYVELYVMKDSTIEQVEDLQDRKVGLMDSMPDEQSSVMLDWVEQSGVSVNVKQYESSLKMVNDLKGRVLDAIILFQPNLSIIEDYEGLEDFSQQIRSLHQIEVEGVGLGEPDQMNVTESPFSVLVSGIDSYGEASTAGRSDVNLLLTVNPVTRQILMLSIPRDMYVEVQNDSQEMDTDKGSMDKLTHTGIYGTEVTQKTIEKFLDTDINFAVRVNFTTLIDLVDDLGGVDVENPNDFSIGERRFPQGTIHMDGKTALLFSRERYSFREGDRERGRNQMRVVSAILNKAFSAELLKNYNSILDTVSHSVQMNIGTKDIAALVNMQLSHPSSWKIYSYSLTGSDGNEYCPALGDNAYVMIVDENVLKNAHQDITAVKNGEKPLFVSE